jgi:HAD superfamily hydrolase (TIGR01509 family)
VAAACILFDLDRTLVDLQSFTDYGAAWKEIAATLPPELVADVPDTDWDRPTQACMAALVALSGHDMWQSTSFRIAAFERAAIAQSVAMPTLHEALTLVGEHPVGVVTLLPADVAREVLAHHHVAIEVIIGRDPQLRPKPHGDGLLRAMELLSCTPAETVMIGDASWDRAAAQAAGAAFIGVPYGGARFPDDTVTAANLRDAVSLALG